MSYRAFQGFALLTAVSAADEGPVLPPPTGAYPAGRATF